MENGSRNLLSLEKELMNDPHYKIRAKALALNHLALAQMQSGSANYHHHNHNAIVGMDDQIGRYNAKWLD